MYTELEKKFMRLCDAYIADLSYDWHPVIKAFALAIKAATDSKKTGQFVGVSNLGTQASPQLVAVVVEKDAEGIMRIVEIHDAKERRIFTEQELNRIVDDELKQLAARSK